MSAKEKLNNLFLDVGTILLIGALIVIWLFTLPWEGLKRLFHRKEEESQEEKKTTFRCPDCGEEFEDYFRVVGFGCFPHSTVCLSVQCPKCKGWGARPLWYDEAEDFDLQFIGSD